MLVIRLTRTGKKNSPAYRVVVADKKRAVKRKFIEILGNYNPTLKPKTIVISKDRALFWMNLGAQPSDTVRNLMCDSGILDKKEKTNKIYGKKLSKKAIKEGPAAEVKPETEEKPAEEIAEAQTTETETPAEEKVEEEKLAENIEDVKPTEEIESPVETTETSEETPAEENPTEKTEEK